MGKEPCWGRGLIIKQLGNLFSIVHLESVASGAGRGNFQNTVAMPRKTRRKFKIWSGDGDASADLAHRNLGGDVTVLDELWKQRNHPTLSWVTRKDRWGLEDREAGQTSVCIPRCIPVYCQCLACPHQQPPLLFAPLIPAQQAGIPHRPSRFPPLLHPLVPTPSSPGVAGPGRDQHLRGNGCAVLSWYQLSNIMQCRQSITHSWWTHTFPGETHTFQKEMHRSFAEAHLL